MTGLRNVIRLAALGSAIAWSGAGWAQQDDDQPARDEQVKPESESTRDKKSTHERKSTSRGQHEKRAEELRRRLDRNRPRLEAEILAQPFRFNLRGDWYFSEARPNDLGARLVPADESLRTQLGLPEGQGLVVKSVAHGGPAFRVGLQVNDVLTSLADKPLGTPADLVKQLKEAGEKPVPLQVLRSGKPMTIQVKPAYHVTFGPVEPTRPRYQLGVQVASLDDTLRTQLKLSDQEGLLVSAVEPGSAAEKAGFKKYDILLAVGDQALKSPEDLVNQIQNSSGKPLTFKVLRGGKTMTVEVTPTLRSDDEVGSLDLGLEPSLRAVRPAGPILPPGFDGPFPFRRPNLPPFPTAYDRLRRQQTGPFPPGQARPLSPPAGRQLGELRGEVMELRRLVEKLQESLASQPDSERKRAER